MKNLNDLTQADHSGGSRRKERDAWLKTSLGVDIEAVGRVAPAAMRAEGAPAQPATQTYVAYEAQSSEAEASPAAMPAEGPPAQPATQTYVAYEARSPEADPPAMASDAMAYQSQATEPSAPPQHEVQDNGVETTSNPYGTQDEKLTVGEGAEDEENTPEGDKAEAKPTATGMKTKRVSDTYEGEHNKAGWRKDHFTWNKTPIDPNETRLTTKLYSEEEQRANQLVQQAGGAFRKGDRSEVTGKMGYVMDESGRMVAFKDGFEKINQDGTREETARPIRDLMTNPSARIEARHHSTALGGEAVVDESGKPVLDAEGRPMMRSKPAAAAGTVEFDAKGKIKSISNASGHYKPTVDYLLQGVEHLLKQGAFFEDELTRLSDDVPEGEKHKPLAADDPDYKLYKTVQAKLAKGRAIAARIRKLTEALDESQDEDKQAEIGGDLEKIKGELDELKAHVDEAQKKLRKSGVGPSNRIREDAKAEFIDVKPGMTGAQVRATTAQKTDVASFLRSGGGNEAQVARKKAALGELKEKSKAKRDE